VTIVETRRPGFSITRLAHWIVLSWGWRRALVAFSAGAVSVLAMAPFDAWPLLFFTFPILVWLVDGAAGGRLGGLPSAAIAGWWFGFGYFLAGLYWVGYAFLVDAKTFGWLLPFAVTALPAGMAIYTALGLALARMLWTRGPSRLLALAVALTLAEWLRGFGNLIIVDHGSQYMSIYGNNQSLLKRPGDAVKAGEVIASAGNSGGNEQSGLYFEMRHEGRPFDPMTWVSREASH